jgi:hypothetical protein
MFTIVKYLNIFYIERRIYMSKRPVVPEKKDKLNKFKMEVAKELGLENQTSEYGSDHGYMGDVPSKIAGKMAKAGNLGGQMVKEMIASVERDMVNKSKK